jgi:hypothetical protein
MHIKEITGIIPRLPSYIITPASHGCILQDSGCFQGIPPAFVKDILSTLNLPRIGIPAHLLCRNGGMFFPIHLSSYPSSDRLCYFRFAGPPLERPRLRVCLVFAHLAQMFPHPVPQGLFLPQRAHISFGCFSPFRSFAMTSLAQP